MVDHLSKSTHFGTLPTAFTASKVVSMVVKHHGFPRFILSSHDPIFVSNFWQKLFELNGTKLEMSSIYHPQRNGQCEITNRYLEHYLRAFTQHKPSTWVSYLPWVEFHFVSTMAFKCPLFKHCTAGNCLTCILGYTRVLTSIPALDEALTTH